MEGYRMLRGRVSGGFWGKIQKRIAKETLDQQYDILNGKGAGSGRISTASALKILNWQRGENPGNTTDMYTVTVSWENGWKRRHTVCGIRRIKGWKSGWMDWWIWSLRHRWRMGM